MSAAIVVAIALSLVEAPAAIAYGSNDEFRAVGITPTIYTSADGQTCTLTAYAAVKESGKHGVTGFKIKFELRSPSDPGYLFTHQSSGYLYSNTFPNDRGSYYWDYTYTGMRFFSGSTYSLWVKVVGLRGWRRDYTRHFKLGDVGCTQIDDGTGQDGGVYEEGGQPVYPGGF